MERPCSRSGSALFLDGPSVFAMDHPATASAPSRPGEAVALPIYPHFGAIESLPRKA